MYVHGQSDELRRGETELQLIANGSTPANRTASPSIIEPRHQPAIKTIGPKSSC